MSREIKFRAWDVDAAEMFYTGDDNGMDFGFVSNLEFGAANLALFLPMEDDYPEKREAVIMQFTGLKDAIGTPVYEGDILRHNSGGGYEAENFIGYEVFFHDGDQANKNIGFQMNRMHFYGAVAGTNKPAPNFIPKEVAKMVVIGNIYENPELI